MRWPCRLSVCRRATAVSLTVASSRARPARRATGASVAPRGRHPGAAATAILLGTRNVFYGLRISALLRLRGVRRLVGAELVIDESTAMSLAHGSDAANRLGFWSTGISVYVLWNLGTLVGAAGAQALSDPRGVGLDAAAPAAFLALLAPRVRRRSAIALACGAAAAAVACVPVLPVGGPVLVAALIAIVVGAVSSRPEPA